MIIRWPGRIPAGRVENSIMSGLDWFPTFVAAAGDGNVVEKLKDGMKLGDRTYKVHLDGYNQLDLIMGKGPSKRNEVWYFTEEHARRGAHQRLQISLHRSAQRVVRRDGKGRLADRDEPTARSVRAHRAHGQSFGYINWYMYEFWRGVFVQQEVAEARRVVRRVPADAKGRELQPRGGEGADRRSDRVEGRVSERRTVA